MVELAYEATEGFAIGMIFAWGVLFLMILGMAFIYIAFIGDAIYNWIDDRSTRKYWKNTSPH